MRSLGPEVVKMVCEEIESKTRDSEVRIKFLWRSDEVEFQISGTRKGVIIAFERLQREVRITTVVSLFM